MDFRHLRYFVAMADAGTMGQAAQAVFVTQSTLSHQLAQLESELGCQLFQRVGRNLRLSDAGRDFLGHARGVLAQLDEAKRSVSSTLALQRGSLRVGVIHSFVASLMPPVAAGFIKAYPGVRLQIAELTGLEIQTQVADGSLDLGVAFYPPTSDAVMGQRLFDDALVLAVPASHALAQRKTVRFSQLGDVPLAMLSQRYATRRLLDTHFERAGIQPKVVVEIDSVDALQRIVEQGVAAAFLPGQFVKANARRSAKLRVLSVTDPQPVRAAGLVWRRSSYRNPAAVVFAEQLGALIKTSTD